MELFQHQKLGIEFLKKNKKAILADSMGMGKTRQAIMAAGESSNRGIVIVCPASLKINWEREIHMIYPEDRVIIVNSGKATHNAGIEKPEGVWTVINYELLPKYIETFKTWIENGYIETIIIDEAHYIKGKATIRTKATLELAEKASRVYLLTGTPVLNRPIELFNMLKAIGHPLGKVRSIFVKKFCGGQPKTIIRDLYNGKTFFVSPKQSYAFRQPQYKKYFFIDETGATHIEELRGYVKDFMLRREKNEVLDLPEKIITEVECELESEHRRKYDNAWDEYIAWIEAHPDASRNVENIKSAQQLVEIGKLKQICSIAKIKRISADMENTVEQGNKIIVFSQYTNTIAAIAEKMRENKIGYATLTGQNNMEERQQAVDDFQTKDEVKVFIANIKAGGIGINLTAASIVIFADMDWSPEINNQAMDRAHRIGQTGTVNVYFYLLNDTIEKDIMEILKQKTVIIKDIMGEKVINSSLDFDSKQE